MAATPVRETSTRPMGRMRSTNSSILSGCPVNSKMKLSVVASTTRARKASASWSASLRLSPRAAHLHHRKLALERALRDGEVGDLVHRHEPFELMMDLLDRLRRARGDDGDARADARHAPLRHGEALDIVAAAREQADDPRQHARLVVDEHGKRMRFDFELRRRRGIG